MQRPDTHWRYLAGRVAVRALALLVLVPSTARAHEGQPFSPHDVWAWSAWSSEWPVLLGLLLSGCLYARGVVVLWRRAGVGRGIRPVHVASYTAGMLGLTLALVSPLHAAGSALLSAHMVQHILLLVLAPVLLLLGRPAMALVWGLPANWRMRLSSQSQPASGLRAVGRRLTQPASAWLLYAATTWLWHVPGLYQAALRTEWVHALEHTTFLGTGLVFWGVVVHAGDGQRLGYGVGLLYLFAMALQGALFAGLMLSARQPWYPAYAPMAEPWGLTPLADQQIAAAIMLAPTKLAYAAAAAVLFVKLQSAVEREVRRRESRA